MYFYLPLILWIIIDLASKQIASIYLISKISLIWDILYLQYAENSGIAFSITLPFIKIITPLLILWIVIYYYKYEKLQNSKLIDTAFGLILAGAIWNGLERVVNGFVIDFIGVKNFAIFNIADIFINIWVLLYLYYLFTNTPKASDRVIA